MSSEVSAYSKIWSYNYDHQKKLVNALLGCTNLLSIRLPWHDIKSGDTRQQQVENLVDACLRYPGRIEWLVDDLFSYERDSQSMLKVFAVLDQIIKLPVSWEKVTQLKNFLTDVNGVPSHEELLKICGKCLPTETLPKEVSQASKDRDTLVYLIDWLVGKGCLSTGKVPILEFVKGVMEYVNTPELETWVNEVAKHFAITFKREDEVGEQNDCREKPVTSFLTPLHLVMVLEPKSKKSKKYDIQTWLFEQGKDGSKQIYVKENITLKELPEQIKQAREKVSQVLIQNPNSLTLEFFLPIDLLLNHNIEGECLPKSKCPISFDYCVLVRPLERLHNRDAFLRWCQIWKKGEKLQQSFASCARWLTEADPKWGKDLGKVFSLNFKPDSDFLGELIEFGTPIVMWNRDEVAKEWHFKLYQEWSCCRLADIPKTLYEERRSIFWDHDKKHTGHLSLLWDDPTRVPPSFQLGPPT